MLVAWRVAEGCVEGGYGMIRGYRHPPTSEQGHITTRAVPPEQGAEYCQSRDRGPLYFEVRYEDHISYRI